MLTTRCQMSPAQARRVAEALIAAANAADVRQESWHAEVQGPDPKTGATVRLLVEVRPGGWDPGKPGT